MEDILMNEVYEYLKKCGIFYLATVEGDQPRVRPFGAKVFLRINYISKLEILKMYLNN